MTVSDHESGEEDRVTAKGHDNLLDKQGIANAVDTISSSPKTATDHVESDLGETGSDPRIATALPESESERNEIGSGPKTTTDPVATASGRTATETRLAVNALDRLTASGKQSESENDGNCHESWPTESQLCNTSLFLDLKIGKHGRIENRSGPTKTLLTHHVTEHAAMSRERQPRKRRGQGESAANEQPPHPQLPKGPSRQRRARAHRTGDQRHFQPSCRTEVEREERKPHGTEHQVHPETPPLLACPPEGREEGEVPGCMTSEEVRARGEVFGTGGTEPEGHECFPSAYDLLFANCSYCAEDHPTQKSQVMSLVHTFPLQLYSPRTNLTHRPRPPFQLLRMQDSSVLYLFRI